MKEEEQVQEVKSPRQPKFVDYKNTTYLRQFLNPHGRMVGKKRGQVAAKHQRDIAEAVKRARYMALIPYVSR